MLNDFKHQHQSIILPPVMEPPLAYLTMFYFSIQTEGKEAEKTEASTAPQTEKKLTNQFNYCERASQTYNNPHRVIYLYFPFLHKILHVPNLLLKSSIEALYCSES